MPDPDLLIRTAGEMRVSNYLLWQISYAELWVTAKCWPDFDVPLLHQALRDYAGANAASAASRRAELMRPCCEPASVMGSLLALLTVGMLLLDDLFAPWYPFLFALFCSLIGQLGLPGVAGLLPRASPPCRGSCLVGVLALVAANWLGRCLDTWSDWSPVRIPGA